MNEQRERRMLSTRQQIVREETAGDLELGLLAACWGDQDNARLLLGLASHEDFHTPSGGQQFQVMRDAWRQYRSSEVYSIRKLSADRGYADSWSNVETCWKSGEWTGYGPGQLKALIEQVRQGSCRHNMLKALSDGQKLLNDPDKSTAEACAEISAAFTKASFLQKVRVAESWEEGFEALEARAQKRIDDEAAGQLISEHLATGMGPLDEIIGGLGVPELIILAARPGVGKTAAGLQISTYVAATAGSVLFLSLELSARVCWTRIACQQLGLEVSDFKKRPDLIRQVRDKNIRLFIDDNPLRVDQLQQRIELFRVEHPDLCLVVIDQLSHLVGDSSDYKAMTRGCNRCCAITKALTMPVMLLTQVGRKGDLREKSRPTISDLKATGSLEEDARKILLIHRPWAHAPGKCDPRDATIIVAKNGDGSSGDADMHYNGPTYTFSTPTEAKFKPRKKKKDDPPPPTDADAPSLLGEKMF